MSLVTAFPNGKKARRLGSLALSTVTAITVATSVQADNFTAQECKVVAGVSGSVIKTLGADSLSSDFRESLFGFVAPDGKKATCTGPTRIATPTANDVAAFNTIRRLLLAGPKPISLQDRGLVSIATSTSN